MKTKKKKKKKKTKNKKTKTKTKIKTKTKAKTKMKTKTEFLLSTSLCVFVNFKWPRGVIVGQLFLIWPRSTIAFSVANLARGLAAPLLVNSLLIGLEVP